MSTLTGEPAHAHVNAPIMPTWKLTIEDDEGQRTVVPLTRDAYTIGRREGHSIRLTERNVSRDHARLWRDAAGWVVEDLGSYNGVFVNGHRLRQAQVLRPGDLVLIGDYRLEPHAEDVSSLPPPALPPAVPVPIPATMALRVVSPMGPPGSSRPPAPPHGVGPGTALAAAAPTLPMGSHLPIGVGPGAQYDPHRGGPGAPADVAGHRANHASPRSPAPPAPTLRSPAPPAPSRLGAEAASLPAGHPPHAAPAADAAMARSAPPVTHVHGELPGADLPSRLVLLTGPEGGREFPLESERMTLGRGDDVDVRLPYASVSRHHCEVRCIEPGQFEARDAGSANGLRVNGRVVKAMRLGDGDVIELGDVQLRFVGAGQTFVLDTAVREAEALRRRRGAGAAIWMGALAVVAMATIGVAVFAKRGSFRAAEQPSGIAAASPAQEALEAAQRLRREGDLHAAHARLATVPPSSSVRKDPRFTEIESAWADRMLKVAAQEPDLEVRRKLLREIKASGAEPGLLESADQALRDLDAPAQPVAAAATETAPATAAAPDSELEEVPARPSASDPSRAGAEHPSAARAPTSAGHPGTTGATAPKPVALADSRTRPVALGTSDPRLHAVPVPSVKPAAPSVPTPVVAKQAEPTIGNCPSWRGDYRSAMKAQDYECVRTMLMPRLNASSISTDEARYLKAACASLGDNACQKRAAEKM